MACCGSRQKECGEMDGQMRQDRQRQAETGRDRQRQTETDRGRQRHTETHRDTQRHTETHREEEEGVSKRFSFDFRTIAPWHTHCRAADLCTCLNTTYTESCAAVQTQCALGPVRQSKQTAVYNHHHHHGFLSLAHGRTEEGVQSQVAGANARLTTDH